MEILSKSTAETQKLAQTLAKKVKPGMVLALFGDLGSGKTTFTRFLVKALGFNSRVQSPTFVIHRRYSCPSVIGRDENEVKQSISVIHHVDLYRLTSKEEVLDIGLLEMLQESHSLVLLEWPELAMDLLPQDTVKLRISQREIEETTAKTVVLHFTTIDETTRHIIVEGLPSLRA